MRTTIIAATTIGTLFLGGCANNTRSQVLLPGVESRDWWYPSTDRNLGKFIQSDQVGHIAFAQEPQTGWYQGHSMLAASDSLGGASFYNTTAYVEAIRLEQQDAVATVPVD